MNAISIRKAQLKDLMDLQSLAKQTFFESFADKNTAADMQEYLEKSFSENTLQKELQNPNSEFYFAWRDDQAMGYLKLNVGAAQTELKDARSVEIERIYVLREYQGQKIGQLLYDTALSVAKKACAEYLWLGVWEKNPGAIRFYQRNGFVEFDKHVFRLGSDEQTDIMMRLKLD